MASVGKEKIEELNGFFYGWKELTKYYIKLASPKHREFYNKFISQKIDYSKSYIINGSYDNLRYFVACYLKTRGTHNTGFIKHDLDKLAFSYQEENEIKLDDILFILNNKYRYRTEKSVSLSFNNIMNLVCYRKSIEEVTIILTSTKMPEYEETGEFNIINIGHMSGVWDSSLEVTTAECKTNKTDITGLATPATLINFVKDNKILQRGLENIKDEVSTLSYLQKQIELGNLDTVKKVLENRS